MFCWASETRTQYLNLQTADSSFSNKREQFQDSVGKLAIGLLESLIRDGGL